MKSNFFKKKFIQLRISLCDRKIKRIAKKISKLNIRRESATTTRDRLVLAINNGHYGYDEIEEFERRKSSQISKVDYELCAIDESTNDLTKLMVEERNRKYKMIRSLQ